MMISPDITIATCLLMAASYFRETHWYWPLLASAAGILCGYLLQERVLR